MVITHAETEARVASEAAIRSDDTDGRRLERIVSRKPKNAVILATFIRRFRRTGDDIVPLQNIVFVGLGRDERRRVGRNAFVFFCEPFLCLSGNHEAGV